MDLLGWEYDDAAHPSGGLQGLSPWYLADLTPYRFPTCSLRLDSLASSLSRTNAWYASTFRLCPDTVTPLKMHRVSYLTSFRCFLKSHLLSGVCPDHPFKIAICPWPARYSGFHSPYPRLMQSATEAYVCGLRCKLAGNTDPCVSFCYVSSTKGQNICGMDEFFFCCLSDFFSFI